MRKALNAKVVGYFFAFGSFLLPFLTLSTSALGAEGVDCSPRTLKPSQTVVGYGRKAQDFTLSTTTGSFSLSANWTGCDSFVVFKSFTVPLGHPLKGLSDAVNLLWKSKFDYLLQFSPQNTHYIFVSQNEDASVRASDNAILESNLNASLSLLSPASRDYWRSRIHVVTEDTASPGGPWIGSIGVESFVIDASQTVRKIGVGAYPPLLQDGDLIKLALEAQYSVFLEAQKQELEKANVTLVKAFDGEVVQAGWAAFGGTIKEVELPSADEMRAFGKLSIDLSLSCPGGTCLYDNNQYYYDRVVEVYLCRDQADKECDLEIGRWVTPFGLGGRWIHDISPLLGLLSGGGKQRLRFHTVDKYTVDLNLRFEKSSEVKPFAFEELYRGGKLDDKFNQREKLVFTVPEGTKKVQLVTVTTGHGWGKDQENCAEFCVTDHEWTINETRLVNSLQGASDQLHCFLATNLGVVPNQPGTWYFGRGGWCPGLEVRPLVWDVSAAVNMGGLNTVGYRALFKGGDYVLEENPNGQELGYAPEINLRSYLVYSK